MKEFEDSDVVVFDEKVRGKKDRRMRAAAF
jgi:hypothetical protein